MKAGGLGFKSCEVSPLSLTLVLQETGRRRSASPGGQGVPQDDDGFGMASMEPDTELVPILCTSDLPPLKEGITKAGVKRPRF